MQVITFLATSPVALLLVTLILGLLVGSFLNVVIYRLPLMLECEWQQQCQALLQSSDQNQTEPEQAEPFNLIVPGSRCPQCSAPIRAWQNIPILSYLWLRGRCANCQAAISIRYPLVELATGLMSVACVWHFGWGAQAGFMLLLTWALIALTMIDFDHQLLPDSITLPFLWLGLIMNSFGVFASLEDALWGAVAGYLILWSIYWLFKLLTGKEGMGYGDFKLLALLGAWFGWQALPLIILLSSLVGAVVGIALMIFKHQGKSVPIPFGPYLAAAGWIAGVWGYQISGLYLNLVGLGAS